MSFLDRVIRGAEFRSGLASPAGWLVDALSGGRSVSGQRVTTRSAMGLSPVFAAVSMISEAAGQMPLKVYREIADPAENETERIEARQHRAWRMLHDKPNASTIAQRFWATVVVHMLLWGNAFIELRRSNGLLVDELWLLDPASTMVQWDDRAKVKTFVQDAGYEPGASQDRRRVWTEDEVLHIFGLSLNGVTGVSRIDWCRNMLGTALARDKFEGGFYDRGAVFSGYLSHPEQLGPEGMANLAMGWRAKYGGAAERGHQTPVLEEGAEFHPISMPLSDMQFLENAQLSRTDIAVMFNLPPSYLGGSTGDSLTYATVESNQLQFVQHAVMPWTTTIEKAITNHPAIFPQNVFYAEFMTEQLLRADASSRADVYTKMFALKDGEGRRAISIDEIRARENMPQAVPEKTPEPQPVLDQANGPVPPELAANAQMMQQIAAKAANGGGQG